MTKNNTNDGTWDRGYDGAAQRRRLQARRMSYAERLKWLESINALMKAIQGKALQSTHRR